MPTRPAVHHPAHHASTVESEAQRNRAKGQTYDRDWRKLRHAFLASNPLCVECQREGKIVPATEADHVIPVAKAPDRRLDETNLQALCATHHSRKTYGETLKR
jgi:5-methylcytosine-specific restriction protein A